MLVLDAHQDIAYNAIQLGRDFRKPAWTNRLREKDLYRPDNYFPGEAMLGLPDALLGRLAVIFATLFVEPPTKHMPSTGRKLAYETPQEAYEKAMKQLDYYKFLQDEDERIRLIRAQSDLDEVLASWEAGTTLADHKIGLVLLMEGADPILEPPQFEEWHAHGVRAVGLAWNATRYAGGTFSPGPLTDLGRELLEILAEFNTILDLSHLTTEGVTEALDRYPGPIMASHSNPRQFFDHVRNLSDDEIRRIAERDGVVGINFYNAFLHPTWYSDGKTDIVSFEQLITVFDHVCQVTGSARHVGIGSDADGGFGAEGVPQGLDTVTDFLRIADGLRARGYAEPDIEQIMSGNFLRILRQALP